MIDRGTDGAEEAALVAGLPVLQPEALDADALRHMRTLAPDVIVVVAYGHKLPATMLALAPHGCINVHASLLPRWRGAAPIQRALLEGDTETGISIMRIDEGWDTGDVLLQKRCPIHATDDAGILEERLCELGQQALLEALTSLQEGRAIATPQDPDAGTYARKLSKEEALIDWARSATAVWRAIRAYAPSPVAHTWLGALRVRVWQAEVVATTGTGSAKPGELVAVSRDGIDVCCGEGVLRITRLQVPVGQGRVLPVSDLLNARGELFRVGARFSAAAASS